MKLGVCTKPENIRTAAEAGYDFAEFNLSKLAKMSNDDFTKLKTEAKSYPIPVLRANGFLPGTLKVTGPEADRDSLGKYLEHALSRAAEIGIDTAVFGSGGARNVPEGFPFERAYRQIAEFLADAALAGKKYGVRVAIEPLRLSECNIINYVSEATILSSLIGSPYITVLADSFHMICGNESFEAVSNAGLLLSHVHISHPLPDLSTRDFPREGDGCDYASFIDAVKKAGYDGTVSIEAGTKNFENDARAAAEYIRKLL